jgi:hypothetical protein
MQRLLHCNQGGAVLKGPACSYSALQRRSLAASALHSVERISNAARSRLVRKLFRADDCEAVARSGVSARNKIRRTQARRKEKAQYPDSISSMALNLETVSISYDAIWLKNLANLSFPRGANVTNLLPFLSL